MKNSSLFVLSSILSTTSILSAKAKQPNVILILTDDQGWGDFGFNDNPNVKTPNLDQMSRSGALMTNFRVSPLSATTRAGLLTGRDHLRSGALTVTRNGENMDTDEMTIAELLKHNGYATGCFGKWHNGAHYPEDPNGQGFDEFVGFCAGHWNNYFDASLQHNQMMIPFTGYITDVLTDYAIEFITQQRDEPFFCYIPYNAPHGPYQAPDEYYNKYKHLSKSDTDPTPAVYAMCENIDTNVGRILSTLKQEGIEEETIIIYLTDNGPNNPRYNGKWRGRKGQVYDGGIRTPFIINWKGKILSAQHSCLTSYIDVLPTIQQLCAAEFPTDSIRPIDGMSFASQLMGEEECGKFNRRLLYTHRANSNDSLEAATGTVYSPDYKLIINPNGIERLYDLTKDPSETNDIASIDTLITAEYRAAYDEWFAGIKKDYNANCSRKTSVGLTNYEVYLPAHEGIKSGAVKYNRSSQGWAGDWYTNIHTNDSISWCVEVADSCSYLIDIEYALPENNDNIRSGITALKANQTIYPQQLEEYKATRIEGPSRISGKIAYDQTWKRLTLGSIVLNKGEERLLINLKSNREGLDGLEIKGIYVEKE